MLHQNTLIVLTPAFPADNSPAQSIWLPAKQALIRCLNRGYPDLEIIILSFQFPSTKTPYYWNGNKVIPFGGANRRNGRQWLVWLQVFRQLNKLRKQKQILAILSFWCAECCFVGHYYSLRWQIKHYCWLCGQDAKIENKFVRRIRPKANELVAMSDFLAITFSKNHGIIPAWTIPDGVDTTLFCQQLPTKDIDIIGAGSLSKLKQFNVFIEIAAALKEIYPQISVQLIGDGEEKENIQQLIKTLGLEQTVILTGFLPQKELLTRMQRSRLLLHTSQYEGFGNVCIEALYAGAEVISFTKPMEQQIPHWHIAKDKSQMLSQAYKILAKLPHIYNKTLPFNMEDSAHMFMKLFEHQHIYPDPARNDNN